MSETKDDKNSEKDTESSKNEIEMNKNEIDTDKENSREETGETTDTCSEKNDSKDMEDEDWYVCKDCKTTECFMWRRLNNVNKDLVCSSCHLKRLKNEISLHSTSSTSSKSSQAAGNGKGKDIVRISKRKNKTNKKFTNGFYGDRIIKSGSSKSRRNLYKRKPVKSPVCGVSSIVASESVYHNVRIFIIVKHAFDKRSGNIIESIIYLF